MVKRTFPIFVLIAFSGILGFLFGFHNGTGEMPTWFREEPQAILPDDVTGNQTFEEVAEFVAEDTTNEEEDYQDGFNCVDFVLAVSRAAEWRGVASEIVRIEYAEPPHHMVIMFPTTNKGMVFYETQTDTEISPAIGAVYNGRRVVGMQVLYMGWMELEDWCVRNGEK